MISGVKKNVVFGSLIFSAEGICVGVGICAYTAVLLF